jgi:peptide/nickel transport system substrate-binding protein
VRFGLKQPYAPFLSAIALGRPMVGAIVSKAAADKLGNANYSEHPIGTGPFVFESRVPNQSISLSRNDRYYEGPPYAKAVRMLNMPDQTTLGLAIEKGEVHIGNARGADTFTKYKDNTRAVLHAGTNYNLVGINVNTRKPPFDKREVRQALAMAVNENELVEGSLAGFGTLCNLGLMVPGVLGYDDSIPVPSYDPDKARSMLAAAGVSNLKVTWPVYTGSDWTTTGALLKEELRAAGVDASIPQLERGALTQSRVDPSADGTVISLTTGADPDAMMRYFTTAQLPPGLNYSWYTGADAQVDASEAALTQDERVAALKKVQQQFAADVPFLPMYHQQATVLTALNFHNFQLDPLGGYWLQKAFLA